MKLGEVKFLYHGTNQLFEKFDFHKAKPFKDFGKGFYLTSNVVQAQRWAQRKARNENKAYIYRYKVGNVEANRWRILELLSYDKAWVDFISKCRIDGQEEAYDIVYDRMADNQVNDISEALQRYIAHEISAEDVIEKVKWKDTYNADQFCFKNEEALELLQGRQVTVLVKDETGKWKIEEVLFDE